MTPMCGASNDSDIMQIISIAQTSKLNQQLPTDNLFCFSCWQLHHIAKLVMMLWCQHCGSSNDSDILMIAYIGQTLKQHE